METGTLSILGILLIGLYYYIKLSLYYDYEKYNTGFKEYDEKLKTKVKNNEQLSLREAFDYRFNKIFGKIVSLLPKVGVVLIIIDIASILI